MMHNRSVSILFEKKINSRRTERNVIDIDIFDTKSDANRIDVFVCGLSRFYFECFIDIVHAKQVHQLDITHLIVAHEHNM